MIRIFLFTYVVISFGYINAVDNKAEEIDFEVEAEYPTTLKYDLNARNSLEQHPWVILTKEEVKKDLDLSSFQFYNKPKKPHTYNMPITLYKCIDVKQHIELNGSITSAQYNTIMAEPEEAILHPYLEKIKTYIEGCYDMTYVINTVHSHNPGLVTPTVKELTSKLLWNRIFHIKQMLRCYRKEHDNTGPFVYPAIEKITKEMIVELSKKDPIYPGLCGHIEALYPDCGKGLAFFKFIGDKIDTALTELHISILQRDLAAQGAEITSLQNKINEQNLHILSLEKNK